MRTLTCLLTLLVLSIPCSAKIIYVDADAKGANDGSSWTDAYNDLWIALTGAPSGTEIRVAQGTYKSLNPLSMSPVSRTDTFQLKNGVTIKGGYAGFGEPDPDARDIDSYVSVMSGDIAGNDIAVASPEQLLTEPTRAENSYHVVTAIGVDANAALDGFTITGGQANGGMYEYTYGGGMYNYDSSPTLIDCKFVANSALERGGGMYVFYENSRPTLNRCTFTFNQAVVGGGIMSYGAPMLTKCTFFENVAELGGGMWSNGGELSRCVFGGNRSGIKGGGIFISYDTIMISCIFSGNSSDRGGAVFAEDCDITVTGCTIIGNRAGYVGGIHNDEGKTFVSNCILWNNIDADGEDESAQIDTADPPTVNYCCIQGLTSALGGTGNIGANPIFVQPGHWDTTGAWVDGDYHLLSSSPCINTGDPSYIAGPGETDLDGNPRIIGGRIDIGVYEFKGPRVIYVDADATGAKNGTSWADAYNYLQDALMVASAGAEIRVAEGTYKPDQFVLSDRPNLGRAETFHLKNDVAIKGGYAGFGEPDPDARDIGSYVSVLSGDINGNDDDDDIEGPEDLLDEPTRADNNYHVVTAIGVDANAVLDGFTITGGQANGGTSEEKHGGGMYNSAAAPTLSNCTFSMNCSQNEGGGMYNEEGSNVTIVDCVFAKNAAERGGGMCNRNNSSPSLTRCTFTENSIYYDYDGAGMANYYNSNPILSHCKFVGNMAESGSGAGMYNFQSSPRLSYCEFVDNVGLFAGGMYNYSSSNPKLMHCTFINNSADRNIGGGMYNNHYCSPILQYCTFKGNSSNGGGGMHNYFYSSPTLTNCQFIGNSAHYGGGGLYNRNNSNPMVTSCKFSGNSADDGGGAICNDGYCAPIVKSCTFSQNSAPNGNAMVFKHYYGGSGASEVHVTNSILWDGGDEISNQDGSTTSITYGNVQGGWSGEGNIDVDPSFVAQGYRDSDGVWVDGDYHLLSGSPCINTGDPTYIHVPGETDLDGNPRIIGGRIDIGAYEFKGPRVIYIDGDATGANDGSSWADAYNYLQDALMMASAVDEIRIAEGTYKPDEFVLSKRPNLGRMETFQLENGVTIKGGYAGFGEPEPDARDVMDYETILSGDIGIADDKSDNSYHVVTSSGTDETAVLDGVTITAGQADGSFPRSHGGGIHNFGGSPTVINCWLKSNYASGGGGGMSSEGEPTFTNCVFRGNQTGGSGGGLYVWSGSATLTGCTIIYNSSTGFGGGGLANQHSNVILDDCRIGGNSAKGGNGGGMAHDGGQYTVTNCHFHHNSAENGGGIWSIDCGDSPERVAVVSDCRFNNNRATNGGAMFNSFSSPTVTRCVFVSNIAESFGGAVYNEDVSRPTFIDCTFNANGADVRGGGMSNDQCRPTLVDCSFRINSADDGGGGMNNTSGGDPILVGCIFEGNWISDGGGGGMYNYGNPTLMDCVFISNSAPYESGGGINNYGTLELMNCMFIANTGARGGGIHNIDGSATLTNCLFSANSADEWAGGLCSNSSTVVLNNCTFATNSSPNGNALGCRSATNMPPSNVEATNCILWNGGDEIWNEDSSTITITYSDIQGGWLGEGNVDADPCFTYPGYWGTGGVWVQGDYHLLAESVCINAGDPGYVAGPNETDLAGNPRVIDGRIDMGVFEVQPGRIIYVDVDATGNNDGSSWEDAYNCLQDALGIAIYGNEIRVAHGIYKPDEGKDITAGDREATFHLHNGVTVKGGYAGAGASDFAPVDPNMRDVELFPTILSGDLAGDDGPDFANYSENSRHVVTGNFAMTAILDGFTIKGGYADGGDGQYPFINNGGGMYNEYGSPSVINCIFADNVAVLYDSEYGGQGAAMYNKYSNTTVDNCTFVGNRTDGPGGGIFNDRSSPTVNNSIFRDNEDSGITFHFESNGSVTNCAFIENKGGFGGAIDCIYDSNPAISNCSFLGNSARFNGGGIYCYIECSPTVTGCVFSGNKAIVQYGGAISNYEMCRPVITNCTFSGNSAARLGGGIYSQRDSNPIITNCIMWGDKAEWGGEEIAMEYFSVGGAPPSGTAVTLSYSDVEGGAAAVYVDANCTLNWGDGNIDADPCFVEPGNWDVNSVWVEGDYHLLEDSVCINAGDPNYLVDPNEADLDGRPRVIGGRIDMGAYEFHCPKIVYVDADAAGNNDGSSWADAYNYLQDALMVASAGDEIRVAEGTYKPDQFVLSKRPNLGRMETFQLKNEVSIKGGYAGFGEKDPDAWDIKLYETVLGGDLAGDDVGDLLDVSRAENSYHVVTGSGTDSSAVLNGFTITGGNAYNDKCSSNDSGGGMYNDNGSPTVANCTFTKNTASDQCGGGGAGMYNRYSNPTVISCEFIGNEYIIADDDGGGGMCNNQSNPTLKDCIFRDNKSNGDGGGILNNRSNPTLTNCVFIDNSSAHEGGGMENRSSSPVLTYCSFVGNSSKYEGGGMRNESGSSPILIGCEFIGNSVFSSSGHAHGGGVCNHYKDSPTLINCLFTGNSAHWGGGMYSYWGTASLTNCTFGGNTANERGGAMYYRNVNSTLTNCIVWGNTAIQGAEIYFEHFEQPATMTVSYCDIRGGEAGIYVEPGNILNWGDGNIDSEPQFADSGNGDYRLSAGSPCVDAGDNDSVPADVCDLDGNTRIYDGDGDGISVVDMGAYELGLPPIEVEMKLVPQALNPGSHGNWVKANFVLPDGFTVEDVDTSRPAEIGQFHIMSESMEVSAKDGLVVVVAVFDRSAFCGIGPFEGEIAVIGYLTSGQSFRGTDTIKILTNKIKHLGILASHWLSVCSSPDWCNGADLDQDAVVNFVDVALLDDCCFEVLSD